MLVAATLTLQLREGTPALNCRTYQGRQWSWPQAHGFCPHPFLGALHVGLTLPGMFVPTLRPAQPPHLIQS